MLSGNKRLLLPKELPPSLWNAEKQHLRLPPQLVIVYKKVLELKGLLTRALEIHKSDSPVGGITQEETDAHFARAFSGSCARVQLAMLDPGNHMPLVANSFALLFGGGRVAIADLPCGAGAAVLSVIHCLAELRRCSVVPREPLDVVLLGAEISEPARAYAETLIKESSATLAEQAITVSAEWMPWDACDELSTVDIINKLTLMAHNCDARYMLVANFSGYLLKGGKLKAAQPQLKQIFQHYSAANACGIWIEPTTNHEPSPLLQKLTGWFTDKCSRFVRILFSEVHHTADSRFELPLRPEANCAVRLAVLRFNLTRS